MERGCNPIWWSVACCVPGVLSAGIIYYVIPNHAGTLGENLPYLRWCAWALGAVQAILLPFIGGYTFRVDASGITVMLGLLAIPIKQIPFADVTSVKAIQNLRVGEAFRGFGWRVNSRSSTTGYVLADGPAFCVATRDWSYIASCPDAAALAAECQRHVPAT